MTVNQLTRQLMTARLTAISYRAIFSPYHEMHPPHSWSSYKRPIQTNNDAEGWHHAINGVAKTNSMNMYLLISILHDKSSRIPMIVKLVT